MKKLLLTATCLFTLNACASIGSGQMQQVTVRTPGATNVRCLVENPDHKYIFFTDETQEIMKSRHDLVVRCQAPGNREQTVHVKRGIDDWTFVNVLNGFVPGTTYDVLSRAAFDYPSEITVSFVGSPVKPYPLPSYHNKDVNKNNPYGDIEYMGSNVMVTNDAKNYQASGLQKKANQYGGGSNYNANTSVKSSGSSLDRIHGQYNSTDSYDPTEEDK